MLPLLICGKRNLSCRRAVDGEDVLSCWVGLPSRASLAGQVALNFADGRAKEKQDTDHRGGESYFPSTADRVTSAFVGFVFPTANKVGVFTEVNYKDKRKRKKWRKQFYLLHTHGCVKTSKTKQTINKWQENKCDYQNPFWCKYAQYCTVFLSGFDMARVF